MNRNILNKSESTRLAARAAKCALAALAGLAFASSSLAQSEPRQPELPSPLCDSVQVPEGSIMAFHAYALGVQMYHWNGTVWVFDAPAAILYADANYQGEIGTHFAGPTWRSNSGSQVIGMRMAACTPDSTAIAWLKLGGLSSEGPGMFNGVSFIQRVNTEGGLAPSTPGTTVGERADVPYRAEYFFYRDQN